MANGYVLGFLLTQTGWISTHIFTPSDSIDTPLFGTSVSSSKDSLVLCVDAPGDNNEKGAFYLYQANM